MATSPVRTGLIGTLVGLLIGLALTGWVWWDMRAGRMSSEAEWTASQEAVEADRAALEERVATLEAQQDLMLARIAVSQAMIELDRRNFGTADEAVDRATAHLTGVDAARAGVNPKGIATLKEQIGGLNLEVAQDLQTQRQELAGIAMRMDDLIRNRADAASGR